MDNKDLQKGMISVVDIATDGKLSDEQSAMFVDFVFNNTVMQGHARKVVVTAENLKINKLGIGKRVATTREVAQDPRYRRGVSTSSVTLSPKEIVVPFDIEDYMLKLNVEKDNIEEHIINMMANQLANDMEEYNFLGNTTGVAVLQSDIIEGGSSSQYIKDDFLSLGDGWIKLMRGTSYTDNLVDYAGADISINMFSQLLSVFPSKFKKDIRKLRFFCSAEFEQLYRELVATRSTPMGDSALNSIAPLTPFGIPLIAVPQLPFTPTYVEHKALTTGVAASLSFAPIANVIITPSTLDQYTPVTPYLETTDYTVDYTNGTITNTGAHIGSGTTVKITYDMNPCVILTLQNNLIQAMRNDFVSFEKDRNIHKKVWENVITAFVDQEIEELEACAFGYNSGKTI